MPTDVYKLPGTVEAGVVHQDAVAGEARGADSIGRNTLRSRMRLVNIIFVTGIVAFTAITHAALQIQVSATDELTRLNEAEQYAQDADRLHDSLRGDLYAALLAPRLDLTDSEGLERAWQAEVARFRNDLQNQARLSLPLAVKDDVDTTRQRAEEFFGKNRRPNRNCHSRPGSNDLRAAKLRGAVYRAWLYFRKTQLGAI